MRRPMPNRLVSSHRILAARRRSTIVRLLALSLLSTVVLEGCVAYHAARWESPPEGQDQIEVGTPRSIVEQILGEPVAKDGPVHTYEYSTEDRPTLALAIIAISADVLWLGMPGVVAWTDAERGYQSQRTRWQLAYGPDDRVISLSPEAANVTFERWLDAEERAADLERLCQAGNNGSADAHAVQAVRYRYGLWGTEVDAVKAYLSLRLAAFFGNPGAAQAIGVWRAGMTPDDVAEADRQYASWQPTPCAGD